MAKKSQPPKPISWNVYKIASKAVWLGEVEAQDEAAAIESRCGKVLATKLMQYDRPIAKAKSPAVISSANGASHRTLGRQGVTGSVAR